MAKNVLPVNYKDDILSASMSGKRRYRINTNPDGTVSFEDVTEYEQQGDSFGAHDVNEITKSINESADQGKVIDSAENIALVNAAGFIAGALAAKEILQMFGGLRLKSLTEAEYQAIPEAQRDPNTLYIRPKEG